MRLKAWVSAKCGFYGSKNRVMANGGNGLVFSADEIEAALSHSFALKVV